MRKESNMDCSREENSRLRRELRELKSRLGEDHGRNKVKLGTFQNTFQNFFHFRQTWRIRYQETLAL